MMFKIKNLSKVYQNTKTTALKNVDFETGDTGLYFIIGESGSGKSTFLKIIGSLDQDYDGSVKYFSKELKSMTEKERYDFLLSKVSLCLQEDELDYKLSVRDNLLLALETYDLNLAIKEDRIKKAVDDVGLSRNLDTELALLSGGEIKRVNIARALVKDYEVLLLDEPTGPLDKNMRKKMMNLFLRISENKLVIVISHNLGEIDVDSNNVLTMKDGRLKADNLTKHSSNKLRKTDLKRRRLSFVSRIVNIFKMFKRRMKYTLLSIFATSLALTSLGITSILTDGVSLALDSYFKDEIDEGSLVIKRKNTKMFSDSYNAVSYYEAKDILKSYNSYIYDVGTYYDGDYENLFSNCNKVYLQRDDKTLRFNDLSLRDFIEFTYIKSTDEVDNIDLQNDEIILGLTRDSIAYLCEFLNLFYKDDIDLINNYLKKNSQSLYLEIRNDSFKYHLVENFKIVKICETKENKVLHSSVYFNEWLVEEEMRFLTSDIKGDYNVPWTFFKSYFLYVVPSERRKFLNLIKRDENFKDLAFSYIDNSENIFDRGKILVMKDYKEKLYLSDIDEILNRYSNYIDNYYVFNSFYTFVEEALTRAFLKPIYISSKKERINELIDVNYDASLDLEGLQGASIITSDDVVKGDIISASNKEGLKFISRYKSSLMKGYYPRSFDEIIISKGLADVIFKNKPFFLDSYVYLATLRGTSYENGLYKNDFSEGKLKVTGVVDDDSLAIYQSPDFILALCEDQFSLSNEETRIDKVLLNFRDPAVLKRVYTDLKDEYNAYDLSMPSIEISEGIDEILNYVKIGLISFSVLTGIIALALITFVIYLFIKNDENKIRLMFLEGYTKNDVTSYYLTLSLTIGFMSFVETVLTMVFIDYMFEFNIENMLGIDIKIMELKPFIIVFLASFLFSIISMFMTYKKFKNVNLSSQFIG